LNLIMDCQERFGLTYMFITHDLSVVEHISTRVAVMYLGTLCELADKKSLYGDPQHPYSRALLSAIPKLGGKGFSHMRLKGEVPTPINLPPGCVFHTRCPFTEERCQREIPALRTLPNGSRAACHALEEGRI
jgi:peptide/nickel transport system ATP-binding protein